MITTSVERVPAHSPEAANEAIHQQITENVMRHARGGRDAISRRLEDLDREWDIERAIEANAASVALVGFGLGALVNRRFMALPALVAGFLLQHALQGWCPPVPLLRKLGFRTTHEIDHERYALKALRGDFRDITTGNTSRAGVERVVDAMRR